MKLIIPQVRTLYYGLELTVRPDANYIVTTADGAVMEYSVKPVLDISCRKPIWKSVKDGSVDGRLICFVDLDGVDYKSSLHPITPLTNSDT